MEQVRQAAQAVDQGVAIRRDGRQDLGAEVSQSPAVCISCWGSSTSPAPTFSIVSNLIFLNPTT